MMKFVVKVDGKDYEISESVSKISFQDSYNDGCSKLEFTYIMEDLIVSNGCVVSFIYNTTNIFYGYVFKVNRGKGKEVTCTAYDQLRYCKTKDSIVISEDTVTTLTRKMCNNYNLKKGTLTDTKYKLASDVKDDNTWLDILYSGMTETKKNNGEQYLLRDEYGTICIRNVKDLQLDLILGNNSLVYDFSYSKSIDDEFYNQIKICLRGGTNIDSQYIYNKDIESISKFGLLQYYESVDNTNVSQAKSKAKTLLKQYNQETENLTLSCLGDTRIRAGVSFYTYIDDIGYKKKRLTVKSVSHNFIPIHTMEVEAMF